MPTKKQVQFTVKNKHAIPAGFFTLDKATYYMFFFKISSVNEKGNIPVPKDKYRILHISSSAETYNNVIAVPLKGDTTVTVDIELDDSLSYSDLKLWAFMFSAYKEGNQFSAYVGSPEQIINTNQIVYYLNHFKEQTEKYVMDIPKSQQAINLQSVLSQNVSTADSLIGKFTRGDSSLRVEHVFKKSPDSQEKIKEIISGASSGQIDPEEAKIRILKLIAKDNTAFGYYTYVFEAQEDLIKKGKISVSDRMIDWEEDKLLRRLRMVA